MLPAFFEDSTNFRGLYEDDLDKKLDYYDSMSLLFGLSDTEKRLAIPFMLKSNALRFFDSHGKHFRKYEDVVLLLMKR